MYYPPSAAPCFGGQLRRPNRSATGTPLPETPIIDQSILILVNTFQRSMRKGAIVAGRTCAPPARNFSAFTGRSVVVHP